MSGKKSKSSDYPTLRATSPGGDRKSPDGNLTNPFTGSEKRRSIGAGGGLKNFHKRDEDEKYDPPETENFPADDPFLAPVKKAKDEEEQGFEEELSYAELQKYKKREKEAARDFEVLSRDHWLARNGHTLTYIGLYLFSILVFFRPYELIPQLGFLSSAAFVFAAATLAVYLPTQLLTEGNVTVFSTEVKAILAMTGIALATIPIAKSPGMAWETFNDTFIKAVLMFIVMVNVLRTRRRLMGLLWLSLAVGVYLSFTSLDMYLNGEFNAEGYRVMVEVGGLFGNPNDMALHLVTMTPLAVTLGIVARSKLAKVFYYLMAGLLVAANTVTYSRGGFLGLLAVTLILLWKLGRKNRLKVFVIAFFAGLVFILVAPGNYGDRILSIFKPGLDAVGSRDQRKELLIRSIVVTLRNPWGIGIGNFPIVGIQNLQTHNAFTQISSEIGLLGLGAYLLLMISPLRKLFAMERILWREGKQNWFYYMSIGFQASIVGFMVSSFFISVAYNWFIYYLVAYAVAFRRMYQIGQAEKEQGGEEKENNPESLFELQRA
ncbi:MAG: O-antigen ligase family protein [Pyrinomonadaceae bacterium]